MIRTFLNAKIHGAICTEVDLNYEGSILIDEDWIDEVGLLVHEQVDVYNKTNGNRHTTYVLPLPRGSNAVSVNGAGAHLTEVGDELIICSYIQLNDNYLSISLIFSDRNKIDFSFSLFTNIHFIFTLLRY